jgi:hypothetical protein
VGRNKIIVANPFVELQIATGGFVPQSYIDSVQLADSTIVPNAKKGYKGKSFIQFSFSLCFRRSTRILAAAGPLGFRNASRRVVGFHDGGYVCRDLPLEKSLRPHTLSFKCY